MSIKQDITQTQARVLIYLSVVRNERKDVTSISNKLDIHYSYIIGVLQAMTAKGWLTKHKVHRHVFYDLTPLAPLERARNTYNADQLQKDLNSYKEVEPNDENNI